MDDENQHGNMVISNDTVINADDSDTSLSQSAKPQADKAIGSTTLERNCTLVSSEKDNSGDMQQNNTIYSAHNDSETCEACAYCKQNCCKNEHCQSDELRDKHENVVEESGDGLPNRCHNADQTKCCILRKSTRLLLSGFCMIAVTGISVADIATDVLTARNYYRSGRMTAFILSLVFLILPPIVLTAGMLRRRGDDSKNSRSSTYCGLKFLIVLANVPLKLYMIWLQICFVVKCFRRFHKWRISKCRKNEESLLKGSLQHSITELSLYKLWNSIFESMPQLLLTIHVIMTTPNLLVDSGGYILIISSIFSFGSLCVGVIFHAFQVKEAESEPLRHRPASHPLRSKSTVLGIPQIVFLSIYTTCFLTSRVVSFSYFVIFFDWFAAILPLVHWMVVFSFFTYRRYVNKNNTMHRYRIKTYHRQSSSFVYVFVHSIMSVFIHIKPECEELLDQPRYYKIIYYLFYITENCFMILTPLIFQSNLPSFDFNQLDELQYMPITYATLGATALGALTCAVYHIAVHKSSKFTREEVFEPCCKCCFGYGGFLCFSCSCCLTKKDDAEIIISCKSLHNHEIYSVSLREMNDWKQSTESKLLNKKSLRKWKIVQNAFNLSKRADDEGAVQDKSVVIDNEPGKLNERMNAANVDFNGEENYPYTMRRTGLNILSDPHGNLFYAPAAEINAEDRSR